VTRGGFDHFTFEFGGAEASICVETQFEKYNDGYFLSHEPGELDDPVRGGIITGCDITMRSRVGLRPICPIYICFDLVVRHSRLVALIMRAAS
jgi:hypothetical protein